jgi:hypothetical protein
MLVQGMKQLLMIRVCRCGKEEAAALAASGLHDGSVCAEQVGGTGNKGTCRRDAAAVAENNAIRTDASRVCLAIEGATAAFWSDSAVAGEEPDPQQPTHNVLPCYLQLLLTCEPLLVQESDDT